MPREIALTLECPLSAEGFWALRMDRGFDDYCARLDSQLCISEPDAVVTDAEGLVFIERLCLLQMKQNPIPPSVRRMIGSPDEFAYRVTCAFHRDRFDADHPYCYSTQFPVMTSRIKVEGKQWLEPVSATACKIHVSAKLSILISGVGGAAERGVEKSMRAAYKDLPVRAANYAAQQRAASTDTSDPSPPVATGASSVRSSAGDAACADADAASAPAVAEQQRPWVESLARCAAPELALLADAVPVLRGVLVRAEAELAALKEEARRKDDEIALLHALLRGAGHWRVAAWTAGLHGTHGPRAGGVPASLPSLMEVWRQGLEAGILISVL